MAGLWTCESGKNCPRRNQNPTSGTARGGDATTRSSGADGRNPFRVTGGHWVHALRG